MNKKYFVKNLDRLEVRDTYKFVSIDSCYLIKNEDNPNGLITEDQYNDFLGLNTECYEENKADYKKEGFTEVIFLGEKAYYLDNGVGDVSGVIGRTATGRTLEIASFCDAGHHIVFPSTHSFYEKIKKANIHGSCFFETMEDIVNVYDGYADDEEIEGYYEEEFV